MENYTRISDSIRKNKSLTATEKLLLGYLQTFQQNPDGTPTNNYCFLQQEKLAEELGESLASIKRAIKSLISKQLLFQAPERFYNGTGKQYKKRKATIMVDDNNPFQEEIQLEVPNIVSNEVKEEVEELVPVLEEEASQSMFGKQIDLYDMIEEVEAEKKYYWDDSLDLYNFMPKLFTGTADEITTATFYFIDNINSTPTMKDFATFLVKSFKEQKYNDYRGPKIDKELIDKVKTLIKQ